MTANVHTGANDVSEVLQQLQQSLWVLDIADPSSQQEQVHSLFTGLILGDSAAPPAAAADRVLLTRTKRARSSSATLVEEKERGASVAIPGVTVRNNQWVLDVEGTHAVEERDKSAGSAEPPPTASVAPWVLSVDDPTQSTAVANNIHNAFLECILGSAPPEPTEQQAATAAAPPQSVAARSPVELEAEAPLTESQEDSQPVERKVHIRTAAEEARRREVQEDIQDLMATAPAEGEEEAGDDILDLEHLSDQEEERDEDEELDPEFQDWIALPTAEEGQGPTADESLALRSSTLALHRLGISERDEQICNDPLPERFKELHLAEGLEGVRAKPLPDGRYVELRHRDEAVWILKQLAKPGQPLATSKDVCQLLVRPFSEIYDDSLVKCVEKVLDLLFYHYLEPANIILYYQSDLMPLLNVLWTAEYIQKCEYDFVSPSFAYCMITGRRQKPAFRPYIHFYPDCKGSIGTGDAKWFVPPETEQVRRKPCVIELGRLLWDIVELDSLCSVLERARQSTVLALQRIVSEKYTDHAAYLLDQRCFSDPFEAFAWQQYAQWNEKLSARSSASMSALAEVTRQSSATSMVRSLGLQDAFETFSICGAQYHANFAERAPNNLCQSPSAENMNIVEWAENVATDLHLHKSGDAVLRLFVDAVVEQFSVLPLVLIEIYHCFLSEGSCYVLPSAKSEDSQRCQYSIASLLESEACEYFDILERQEAGLCRVSLFLDDARIQEVLDLERLYYIKAKGVADTWGDRRFEIVAPLIKSILRTVTPAVDKALRKACDGALRRRCASSLGAYCAEGPYERTVLALDNFSVDASLWEPGWNVVEALPATKDAWKQDFVVGSARVCGAYMAPNEITYFACIDNVGSLVGSTHWVPCAERSEEGAERLKQQKDALLKLLCDAQPNVIAIGCCGGPSRNLFSQIKKWVSEQASLIKTDIPVVWASPCIATACTSSATLQKELATSDPALLTALSLARSVQNPLWTMCYLFKPRQRYPAAPVGA